MSTVLLDTDVVSFLLKGDSRRELYTPYLRDREPAIAIMTVAELYQWAAMHRWGESRVQRMEIWLERLTILPVDIETCRVWAAIRAQRFSHGMPISPQDAWIAATALRYQIPLITHNAGDYLQIPDLMVINEQ